MYNIQHFIFYVGAGLTTITIASIAKRVFKRKKKRRVKKTQSKPTAKKAVKRNG